MLTLHSGHHADAFARCSHLALNVDRAAELHTIDLALAHGEFADAMGRSGRNEPGLALFIGAEDAIADQRVRAGGECSPLVWRISLLGLLLFGVFPRQTNHPPVGVFQHQRAPAEAGHHEAHAAGVFLRGDRHGARRFELAGFQKLDENHTGLWRGLPASGRAVDLIEPSPVSRELQIGRLVTQRAVALELRAAFSDQRVALSRSTVCAKERERCGNQGYSNHRRKPPKKLHIRQHITTRQILYFARPQTDRLTASRRRLRF